MKLIKWIYELSVYSNNDCFNYMIYPEFDDSTADQWFFREPKDLKISQQKIIYEDGSEYILPISDIIEVLLDRTGFIVVYGKNPQKFSKETTYPWFFERPHNAAVYNSDGSLRSQIKNPWKDGYIFMFAQPSMKYPKFPSVILDSEIAPNNSSFFELYAIDPNSPELIATGQEIRL